MGKPVLLFFSQSFDCESPRRCLLFELFGEIFDELVVSVSASTVASRGCALSSVR